MKALSIKQPWAWLIVNGYKDIENRNWRRKYRGKLLIHASLKFDKKAYDEITKSRPDIPLPDPKDYEHGGIVGSVELVDIVTESNSEWFIGVYGFKLTNPKVLPFKKLKGKVFIFEV